MWVHLDVKPENIIMGIPPRLIDLSLARTLGARRSGPAPAIGTRAYMPPEQCDSGRVGEIGLAGRRLGPGRDRLPGDHRRAAVSDRRRRSRPRRPVSAGPRWSRRPMPDTVPAELASSSLPCLRHDPANAPPRPRSRSALEPLVSRAPPQAVLGRRGAGAASVDRRGVRRRPVAGPSPGPGSYYARRRGIHGHEWRQRRPPAAGGYLALTEGPETPPRGSGR